MVCSKTSGGRTHSGTSSLKSAADRRKRFTAVSCCVQLDGCNRPGIAISIAWMSFSLRRVCSSSVGHIVIQIPTRLTAWCRSSRPVDVLVLMLVVVVVVGLRARTVTEGVDANLNAFRSASVCC